MNRKTVRQGIALFLAVLMLTLIAPVPAAAEQSLDGYLRGVWVATVINIDFAKAFTAADIKYQMDTILTNAKDAGLTAVFFQVRPTCDAFYKSKIFPWSEYLTGIQGGAPENGFDPLTYLCEKGREMGIEIHAWINPYRVTMKAGTKLTDLASNNPARLNPGIVRSFADGKLYLDPGEPAAQQLVLDGVRELVSNYDLSGVHFDDYFYPSANAGVFPDDGTYKKYGGKLSKADWRRQNTYNLVKLTRDLIKSIKPEALFGVSPIGIWANKKSNSLGSDTTGFEAYSAVFADSRKWVKDGILDYIAPQIYWSIGFKTAEYKHLINWWADVAKGTNVRLFIGHALYKVGDTAQPGWTDPNQIPNQIAVNRTRGEVSGSIFYNYSSLKANKLGVTDSLAKLFVPEHVPNTPTQPNTPAATAKELTFSYPPSGVTTSYEKIYLIGTADKDIPVMLDGMPIARTASGHFALYLTLTPGENRFDFTYNGGAYTYIANRSSGSSTPAAPYVMTAESIKPGSMSPTGALILRTGESFILSCIAPAGSTVSAKVGNTVVVLKQEKLINSPQGMPLASFSANFVMQEQGISGKKSFGKIEYTGQLNGKTFTGSSDGELYFYKPNPRQLGTILTSNTVMRTSNSSSTTRLTALEKGVTDYIVNESPSYYKFKYGGWTLKENVKLTSGTLPANKITALGGTRDTENTYIRWKMPNFTPYKISVTGTTVTVVFPNTAGYKAFPMAAANPLFKSIIYKQQGNDAVYTFGLKNPNKFFGYSVSYSGGKFIITFKNPPTISSGAKTLSGKTVVLDAGHGGSDRGAIGPEGASGRNEKDLNLSVALALEKKLKEKGAKVILTRGEDKTLSLESRGALTSEKKPNLFISIHHNSLNINYDIKNYTGIITMYSEGFSKPFAQTIQKNLVAALGRKDGGLRDEGLFVCRTYECPSVLVEMGFISNPYEFELLSDADVIDREAEALATGIEDFLLGK